MADVITLIEQDHRQVERVFDRLRSGSGKRRQLLTELEELLVPHTEAEEQAVYPTMDREDLESFDRSEAEGEHLEASNLLNLLKTQLDDDGRFEATLEQLVEAVRHHVEEEEQEMLPELRRQTDADMLDKLGQRFEQAKSGVLEAVQDARSDRSRGEPPSTTSPGTGSSDLLDLTKEELYEKAKALDIEGRSKMNKKELASAVSRAG